MREWMHHEIIIPKREVVVKVSSSAKFLWHQHVKLLWFPVKILFFTQLFSFRDFLFFFILFYYLLLIFFTCTLKTYFFCYLLCVMSRFAITRLDKFLISLPIRHLPYQKFRIILNIVLIVNEFECCVFFPAAPIQLGESKAAVVLVFSSFFYSQSQSRERNFTSTKDTWSRARQKNQLCVQWMNGKMKKKYTNVQKSHFTFTCCLPPFHLAFFYFNTRYALLLARSYMLAPKKKSLSCCKPDQNVKDEKYIRKSRVGMGKGDRVQAFDIKHDNSAGGKAWPTFVYCWQTGHSV